MFFIVVFEMFYFIFFPLFLDFSGVPQPGSPQPGPSSAWDGYALDNSFMLNTVQQMGEHNLETIDLNVLQGLLYDDVKKMYCNILRI